MSVVHENFWKWRIKLLVPALLLGLMALSIIKRYILPFVFSLIIVLGFSGASQASSWNDVLLWLSTNTAPAGCKFFLKQTLTVDGSGFRIWKRCNGNTVESYSARFGGSAGSPVSSGNTYSIEKCDGSGATQNLANTNYWMEEYQYFKSTFCDGSQGAMVGYQTTGGQFADKLKANPCFKVSYPSNNCASLDTLAAEFIPVTENCTYSQLGQYAKSVGTGTDYDYFMEVADTGTTQACNQCIPTGGLPLSNYAGTGGIYSAHNAVNENGNIACYYQDIVGDPVELVDSYGLVSVGGGSSDDLGPQRPIESITTSTEQVSDGTSTETHTTTTTTTTNPDGTSTTTSSTAVTNCIDANADGISDVSGVRCNQVSTSTTTADNTAPVFYPSVVSPSGYSNGSLASKALADYGIRFNDFFNTIQGSQLFSQFSLSGLAPSGAGNSISTLDLGGYGTHNFDLSNYSTALSIIKGFMLLLASYLAVRAVVMKK